MSQVQATAVNLILGTDAVLLLLFFFAGVIGAWWALGALRWDKIVTQPLSAQTQLLRFFLALFGGLLSVVVAILLLGAMQLFHSTL